MGFSQHAKRGGLSPSLTSPLPSTPTSSASQAPSLSAFGKQRLEEIKQRKANRTQAVAKNLWQEEQEVSIHDTTDLSHEEKEWIEQQEAERRYQHIVTDIQQFKDNQVTICEELHQIKQDITKVKDLVTQLTQIFLEAPPAATH